MCLEKQEAQPQRKREVRTMKCSRQICRRAGPRGSMRARRWPSPLRRRAESNLSVRHRLFGNETREIGEPGSDQRACGEINPVCAAQIRARKSVFRALLEFVRPRMQQAGCKQSC